MNERPPPLFVDAEPGYYTSSSDDEADFIQENALSARIHISARTGSARGGRGEIIAKEIREYNNNRKKQLGLGAAAHRLIPTENSMHSYNPSSFSKPDIPKPNKPIAKGRADAQFKRTINAAVRCYPFIPLSREQLYTSKSKDRVFSYDIESYPDISEYSASIALSRQTSQLLLEDHSADVSRVRRQKEELERESIEITSFAERYRETIIHNPRRSPSPPSRPLRSSPTLHAASQQRSKAIDSPESLSLQGIRAQPPRPFSSQSNRKALGPSNGLKRPTTAAEAPAAAVAAAPSTLNVSASFLSLEGRQTTNFLSGSHDRLKSKIGPHQFHLDLPVYSAPAPPPPPPMSIPALANEKESISMDASLALSLSQQATPTSLSSRSNGAVSSVRIQPRSARPLSSASSSSSASLSYDQEPQSFDSRPSSGSVSHHMPISRPDSAGWSPSSLLQIQHVKDSALVPKVFLEQGMQPLSRSSSAIDQGTTRGWSAKERPTRKLMVVHEASPPQVPPSPPRASSPSHSLSRSSSLLEQKQSILSRLSASNVSPFAPPVRPDSPPLSISGFGPTATSRPSSPEVRSPSPETLFEPRPVSPPKMFAPIMEEYPEETPVVVPVENREEENSLAHQLPDHISAIKEPYVQLLYLTKSMQSGIISDNSAARLFGTKPHRHHAPSPSQSNMSSTPSVVSSPASTHLAPLLGAHSMQQIPSASEVGRFPWRKRF